MAQEAEATPQPGPEPAPAPESKEGQEPKGEPKRAPETFDKLSPETQAQIKELRSEAAASRKARQDLEAKLAEYEDRDKSELEKLTGKLTKAEQRAAEAEGTLLRFQVGAEKGLDPELLPFLTGSSKEELETKADVLLAKVGQKEKPDFDGGAREPTPEPKAPLDAHQQFLVEKVFGRPPDTAGTPT